MALTRSTVGGLMHAHVEQASAETERPVSLVPYRVRRRRAAMYRICIAVACTSLAALPALIAASYG